MNGRIFESIAYLDSDTIFNNDARSENNIGTDSTSSSDFDRRMGQDIAFDSISAGEKIRGLEKTLLKEKKENVSFTFCLRELSFKHMPVR